MSGRRRTWRRSSSSSTSRAAACRRTAPYRLSDAQAQAILELRLQRLTGLERDKIGAELQELATTIKDYLDILGSRPRRLDILRTELREVKEQFGTPRRTEIMDLEFEQDIEDLIQREDMVVTVTHGGYIKRVPLSSYRAQRRGGKGRAAMATREEDFVTQLFVVNTHTPVVFFSTTGIVYKMKVYRLPLGTPQARGKALVNLLPLKEGETISTLMPLPEDEASWADMSIMFATDKGTVRRNKLSDFVDVKANGKIAMKLEEGDRLIAVQTCTENDDVLLAAAGGKSIRFPVNDVRVFTGRTSVGVRGIKLEENDHVISMSILRHVDADTGERVAYLRMRRSATGDETPVESDGVESDGEETAEAATISAERYAELEGKEEFILTVTSNGYGKRSSAYEYRITGRGGQGIANMEHHRTQRPGGGVLPGGRARPDHAGDRRRAADPLPGERHPHRRPQDPGRDAVQGRGAASAWSRSPASATRRKATAMATQTAPAMAPPTAARTVPRGTAATVPTGTTTMADHSIAVYPGTFDPITNGHMDIIRRAARPGRSPDHRRGDAMPARTRC